MLLALGTVRVDCNVKYVRDRFLVHPVLRGLPLELEIGRIQRGQLLLALLQLDLALVSQLEIERENRTLSGNGLKRDLATELAYDLV